jgi:hypothetical protein
MSAVPALVQRSRVIPYPKLSRDSSPHRLATRLACLKLHLSALVVCALSCFFLSPSLSLIFNGCIVGAAYLWLGVTEARRGPLWLTPLSVFFFFYGVEMGPASVYMGYGLHASPWLPFTQWMLPAKDVAAGYLIALLGMLAMHAGLEALRPHQKFATAPPCQSRFPFLSLGVLWLSAVVSIYRPRAVIPLGMFGVVLQYGGLAALLPLAFISSRQLRVFRLTHVTLFVIGTCGLLAAAAASQYSSKMEVILALLPLGALLIRTKGFRKWLPFALTVGFFLYLALVAPAINNSRAIPTVQGLTTWDKVVESAEAHSILASGESTWDLLSEQYGNLMLRMFEPPSATAFMVGEVAHSGLQLGETMRTLEYAFIPRIVWPGKPIVSRGAWFTTYIGMAPRPQEATSSTGMTAFGEWYWNFGIPGELGGMLLTGLLLGGLWRLVGNYPVFEPLKMLLYCAILVDSVMLPEASSVVVTMVALYLLFGGLVIFRKMAADYAVFAAGGRPRRDFLRA